MKTFKKVAAQGDVMFIRMEGGVPEGFTKVEPEGNRLIITHSETGHHHWMDSGAVTMFANPDDPLEAVIEVSSPTHIVHERSFDTHEPIMFDGGVYRVRRQREYTPEGWRRVAD